MRKVHPVPFSGCWLWTGAIFARQGYGQVRIGTRANSRLELAHLAMYREMIGPVPDGLELDHTCRVVLCVNPDHLEPVTHAENMRRSPLMQAHWQRQRDITLCPYGHEYAGDNLRISKSGRRHCRACDRERYA